jgi:chromosome segregation ATPase
MATQPQALDGGQLQTVVAWLEDQRRQDREELARVAAELERLSQNGREHAAQLAELRAQVDEGRSALQRLPILDDALREAREQVAQAAERADQQSQQITQTLLLRAADAERDRKQVGDLLGQIAKLEDALQALEGRARVVADEARRDRGRIQELPNELHGVGQRVGALTHRIDQLEERLRRVENLVAARADEMDELRTDLAKTTQWRQLADVRWSRQVAEWQETLDDFRQAAEESTRPVQQLVAQVGQARDDVRGAQGTLADHARRLEEAASALTRLEAALAQQREATGRLEQLADAQRRRFDEQASAQLRLDEAIGRSGDQARTIERSLEEQVRRIEQGQTALRAAEAAIARQRDDVAHVETVLRRDLEAFGASLTTNVARLEELASTQAGRLDDLTRVFREQRQRLAIELEQQARELQELRPTPGPA